MGNQLLHIFRNTPIGRETFLQSLHLCRQVNAQPVVYIPGFVKFLMYFENAVVQVDLDDSYLTAPATAEAHARELIAGFDLTPKFFVPKNFTSATLPDIPPTFDFMCWPRNNRDFRPGWTGHGLRRLLASARFPILVPNMVYKPWTRLAVFFGGAANAFSALKLGIRLARETGSPLDLFTQEENRPRRAYETAIREMGLEEELGRVMHRWEFFDRDACETSLYAVPHDALVILGARGRGLVHNLVFGSTSEKIRSILPNSLLIAGPQYTADTSVGSE